MRALYREGGLLYRRGKMVKANVMEEFLAIANTILLGSHTRHLKQNKTFNGHFTVVYLVAKPLIWSEAEGDLVVIETSI